MKGVVVEKPGADYEIRDNIPKPSPGTTELLIKSLAVGINPVSAYHLYLLFLIYRAHANWLFFERNFPPLCRADGGGCAILHIFSETFQQQYGLLVSSWPQVLGCDASGEVVEVGEEAAKNGWKIGDRVCGCIRLGDTGYCTFQDYFLMDMKYTIKPPSSVSPLQAATIGVGTETALLGLTNGLKVSLDEIKNGASQKDEWIIILGGAGSVGSFAIQFARNAGYKVMASCSPRNAKLVESLGATAVLDYTKSSEEQAAFVNSTTGGTFTKIFDAVAKSHDFAIDILSKASSSSPKLFATTNDWDKIESDKVNIYQVALGPVGKPDAAINADIERYIPVVETLLGNGKLVPNEVYEVEGGGYEGIIKGIKIHAEGKAGGKKVVVKIA